MDIVWTVVTKYKDGHESLNCICEKKKKAKKERDFLEEKARLRKLMTCQKTLAM